jgi:hypothetical protein
VSVSDGQKANQTTFNNAFLSRTQNSDTVGVVGLNNTSDVNSGSQIVNAQRAVNKLFDSDGTAGEADGNAKNYANNNFIVDGDSRKVAIERLDLQLGLTNDEANSLRDLSGTAPGDDDLGTFTGSTISDDVTVKTALQELETEVELKIDLTEKGAALGVATLDAGGKVPVTQLPSTVMEYQGNWNASTNTPTLADGVGDNGDIYRVNVAGTQDLGSGSQTFAVGDWVIYNGSIWQKSINSNDVGSVNGFTGTVVLDTDDLTEGSSNLYYTDARADARIAAASIDDLADVDTSTTPPTTGQALVWDGLNWIPGAGGSGSGVGGINYIENFDAEDDVSGWTAYADAAASQPVDGTGGSPTSSIAQTTTVSEVLRGSGSFKFSKGAANYQGEGFSVDFTMDRADYVGGRQIYVKFNYQTSVNFATGDLRLFIYDKDAASLIQLVNGENAEVIASQTPGIFLAVFTPQNSTSNDFRLIGHIATTNANAWNIIFDQVIVGPDSLSQAAEVTDVQNWTPTGSWTTNTSYTGKKWRVGAIGFYEVKIALTGAPNAATLTVNMPSGEVIDTNKLVGSQTEQILGRARYLDSGVGFFLSEVNLGSSGSLVQVDAFTSSGSYVSREGINQASPITWASGDSLILTWSAPIAGWSQGPILSNQELIYTAVKARYQTDAGQSLTTGVSAIINFEDKTFDDFGTVTTGGSWKFTAPKTGYYRVSSSILFNNSATWSLDEPLALYLNKNGTLYATLMQYAAAGSVTSNLGLNGSTIVRLNKGDYIHLSLLQSSGSTLSILPVGAYNFVDIEEIPDFSKFSAFGGPLIPHVTRLTSGSGTFSVNPSTVYMRVRAVGGGGGGAGSGVGGTATSGGGGGNTTFNALTANGGGAGVQGTGAGATGGSASGGGSWVLVAALQGGSGGGAGALDSISECYPYGGQGGASAFGGGGYAGAAANAGGSAPANTGSGGGGASSNNGGQRNCGSGGGAGGYVEAIINSPATSYSYAVGAGGGGGGAGSGGTTGGAGAAGIIIIEEYY